MLTLNEALKAAGLPQRKLDEKKHLSSDEVKALLVPRATGETKKRLEAAQFKFNGRGVEHVTDRMDDDDPVFNQKSDIYDSNVDGWFIRAVVMDDGSARLIYSQKGSSHNYDED